MLQNDILLVVQGARRMLEHASQGLLRQSGLRLVELDVLCFLANAGAGDTARDISEARKISKAHISKAVGQSPPRRVHHAAPRRGGPPLPASQPDAAGPRLRRRLL